MKRQSLFLFAISFALVACGFCWVATAPIYEFHELLASADQGTVVVIGSIEEMGQPTRYRLDVYDVSSGRDGGRLRVRHFEESTRLEFALTPDGTCLAMVDVEQIRLFALTKNRLRLADVYSKPDAFPYYLSLHWSDDGNYLVFNTIAERSGAESMSDAVLDRSNGELLSGGLSKRFSIQQLLGQRSLLVAVWKNYAMMGQNPVIVKVWLGPESGSRTALNRTKAVLTAYGILSGSIGDSITVPHNYVSAIYLSETRELLAVDHRGQLACFNKDGRTRQVISSLIPPWQRIAVGTILMSFVWWMLWSFATRSLERTLKPLGDVSMLVLLAIGICCLRFIDHPGEVQLMRPGPTFLLATCSSAVGVLSMWLMFGKTQWSSRMTINLLGLTAIWGVMVYHIRGIELTEATVLLASVAGASLLIAAVCRSFAFQVTHPADVNRALYATSNHGFHIHDLLVWTLAFSVLFSLDNIGQPEWMKASDILWVMVRGAIVASALGVAIWTVISHSAWWLRVVVLTFCVSTAYCLCHTSLNVIHWEETLVITTITFLAALSLRWNGYAFASTSELAYGTVGEN